MCFISKIIKDRKYFFLQLIANKTNNRGYNKPMIISGKSNVICNKICQFNPFLVTRLSWVFYHQIEQKGTPFAIHSPFLLPSFFLAGQRKGEDNNQSCGQKVIPFCSILPLSHQCRSCINMSLVLGSQTKQFFCFHC